MGEGCSNQKKTSVGGVWIFSVTTQCVNTKFVWEFIKTGLGKVPAVGRAAIHLRQWPIKLIEGLTVGAHSILISVHSVWRYNTELT